MRGAAGNGGPYRDNIAGLAYGIAAIVALVWFRRVLAAERERTVGALAGPDPPATMHP